ncbi:DMT family transporter [Aegicerativicinus sediminis]|uniref:DMT family transporter n=1 Tax=Aegicerativicinus sediminis TaxID=2893202 RepID=UPI001E2CC0FC|nr:DMT family transporter [Aegicerativicinus sediminis]
MPNVKFKSYLHLHFLVFIAGFTAVLGDLISIGAVELVWFRMVMASLLMFIYLILTRGWFSVSRKQYLFYAIAGFCIALHWITFFESIKRANVSIALSMFSCGAFFASIIEPLFFKRRLRIYELFFGLLVVFGVILITRSELQYLDGIIIGISSALFSTLFSVMNGKFINTNNNATAISLIEFVFGIAFISIYLLIKGNLLDASFFNLVPSDWLYLFLLASVCTAYAFIAAMNIMKHLSPYTVVLSYNLEPVYGILLALWIFPEQEKMSFQFYIGALLILGVIMANGILTRRRKYLPVQS